MKLTESLVLLGLIFSASGRSLDLTQQQDTSGADVVRGVLSKIEASNVFTTSTTSIQRQVTEEFMRETAYVESLDGTDYPLGVRDGGVWRISMDIFQQTQQYNYSSLFTQITEQFCISWTDVEYAELRKPLYSGLAVRIYLFHLYSVNLGLSDAANDNERATFWINNFGNSSRIMSTWFIRVDELRKIEVCRVNTDVMFIIDSSGSIGDTNYQTVRQYTYNFTKGLLSGGRDSRIGVILFGDSASVEIELDFHDNAQVLLNSISNLRYLNEGTNMPQGLCLLKFRPWRESLSVLRTAIVLTDGMSNENSPTCRVGSRDGTVSDVAAEVHRLSPQVLVYAVGVGDYDINELNIIATSPDFVSELASFDEERLEQNQRSRTYSICFKDTQSSSIGNLQTGTARNSSVSRHEFSAPAEEGVTIRICITEGVIVIYGSYTIPNPSAALYDFSEVLRAEGEVAMNCHTSYANISNTIQSSCNTTRARNQVDNKVTVYVTIEGMSRTQSNFSINSSLGIAFECARGADLCGEHAVFRIDGRCFCECAEGYEGDGQHCRTVLVTLAVTFSVGLVILLGGMVTAVVCFVCIVRRRNTYRRFDVPETKIQYKKSDGTVELTKSDDTMETSKSDNTVETKSDDTVEIAKSDDTVEIKSDDTVEIKSDDTVEIAKSDDTVEITKSNDTIEIVKSDDTVEITDINKSNDTVEISKPDNTVEITESDETVDMN